MLRFAIPPTSDMHTGDMRVALISYIVARQRAEQFAVRVEDTDKNRNIEGKDQEILDILKKFAMEQDQLFYQRDNLGRHQQFALSLLEKGKAFACICTDQELKSGKCSKKCSKKTEEIAKKIKEEKIPFVIRIPQPKKPISFTDKIKGEIVTRVNEIDSFVILGADGSPSYNFASSCDDMLADISIVICSEDHMSDTPKQIHIKRSLGYTKESEYAHLPIMLNESSKKDDDISIKWLLEQGYLPDAIINYLLGLGVKTPNEVFTLPDAIEWFDLVNISKDPVKFDIDKLRFLNRKHISNIDDKRLSKIFGFADADIGKLIKIYLEETSTINELELKIKAIFEPKELDTEWAEEMKSIAEVIRTAPMLNSFDNFKEYIVSQSGIDGKRLSQPLRILMTGAQNGPELGDIYPLIRPYITEIARNAT
ncbi:MAG TPA: glutamate--tRNA ligase [Sulfurovum sp.]|nr:glutamate--tRNA ligase [Sulfurovum sp.]